MNQHQQIVAELARQYEAMRDAVIVGPGSLAFGVYQHFAKGDENPNIQYASIEHLKQMARRYLARNHDADSDENPAHRSQGEFSFSGQLQERYPLPRKGDEEPAYKLRSQLTDDERHWNVEQLRKSAGARLQHADALEAEGQQTVAA